VCHCPSPWEFAARPWRPKQPGLRFSFTVGIQNRDGIPQPQRIALQERRITLRKVPEPVVKNADSWRFIQ
jgi:hypothetical protein